MPLHVLMLFLLFLRTVVKMIHSSGGEISETLVSNLPDVLDVRAELT